MSHGRIYKKLMNSREWRELRVSILREHPLCQWCEAKGYVVPARECHHLVECESGRTEAEIRELCFRRSNIVALCHQCHANHHKALRYHSTEAIRERNEQRQAAWADSLTKRFTKS